MREGWVNHVNDFPLPLEMYGELEFMQLNEI